MKVTKKMKNVIAILLILTSFTSCVNEKNYVKYHHKEEPTSAKYCADWYPIKETIRTITEYKQGEEVIIPGESEIVRINCDSVKKQKVKNNTVYVKVPGPQRVDTFIKKEIITQENTAYKSSMQDSINAYANKNIVLQEKLTETKKFRNIFGGSLAVIIAGGIAIAYLKAKESFIRKV